MNKIIKNNKGAVAILLTLLVMMAMLFVALTASDIIGNGLQMSKAHVNSTKAYYGAESGIERILWEIRKNDNNSNFAGTLDPVGPPVVPAAFVSGECMTFDGGNEIANPPTTNTTCGTGSTVQTLISNGVEYYIKYSYVGGIVKFRSVGNYHDSTKRVVQIGYAD